MRFGGLHPWGTVSEVFTCYLMYIVHLLWFYSGRQRRRYSLGGRERGAKLSRVKSKRARQTVAEAARRLLRVASLVSDYRRSEHGRRETKAEALDTLRAVG